MAFLPWITTESIIPPEQLEAIRRKNTGPLSEPDEEPPENPFAEEEAALAEQNAKSQPASSPPTAQVEGEVVDLGSSEGYIYTDPKTGRKVGKAWGVSGATTRVPVQRYREEATRLIGKTPGTTASSLKDFEQFASQPPATLGEAMSKPQRQVGAMDEMSREMAAYDFWKNEPAPVVKSADVPWTETFVQTGDPAWESKKTAAEQAWAIASAKDKEKVQNMTLPQYTEWFNSITDPYSGRPITDETMKTYLWDLGKRYMPKNVKADYEGNKQSEDVIKAAKRSAYWARTAPSFMQSQGLEGYEPGDTPGTLKKMEPPKQADPAKERSSKMAEAKFLSDIISKAEGLALDDETIRQYRERLIQLATELSGGQQQPTQQKAASYKNFRVQ